MSAQSEMKSVADNIGKYVYLKHVEPKLANVVRFYIATVVEGASNGKITVERPMESSQIKLPYVPSAANLDQGDKCVVLTFGSMSNGIIVGDGTLSNW